MKKLHLLALLFIFPFAISAQSIHGIWTGTLANDSTHRIQEFELGLSEYRGKITGYTYTTFIANDTFYCSIKRIKAERINGNLVIEDAEMVWNNFPEKAAKGVKQTTTFPLINDTTIDITKGRWNTNQTKRYYSIGGAAAVRKLKDDEESDLLAHLQEINVKTDLIAKKEEKKKDEVIVASYAETKPIQQPAITQKIPENKNNDVAKNSVQPPVEKPVLQGTDHTEKPPNSQTSIDENKKNEVASKPDVKDGGQNQGLVVNNKSAQNVFNDKPQSPFSTNSNKKNEIISENKSSVATTPEKKQQDIAQNNLQKNDQQLIKKEEPKVESAIVAANTANQQKEIQKPERTELPTFVASRKNETIQDIYFKNDSLILALYDNGIVDGDTVSVFMNGENLISKQMLKASASKKTVYIPANADSLQLVLFAENLGTIPPNTGLLTIRDGDDVYQVRFSADLQKNASIILRRKK